MIKIDCDKEKADQLYKDLTKLQAYITGWENAGKMSPPGSSAVWQVRQLLAKAK